MSQRKEINHSKSTLNIESWNFLADQPKSSLNFVKLEKGMFDLFLKSFSLCDFSYPKGFACWLGNIASILFVSVYVPQFRLNYKRKSVEGFSLSSVVLKYSGNAFLFVNSIFQKAAIPILLYGGLSLVIQFGFLIQFYQYKSDILALLYTTIPMIPYFINIAVPSLVPITDSIKPITQVLSLVAQVVKCIKLKTTVGVSIFGQHLNVIGAFLGFIMCILIGPMPLSTWLIYINSLIQGTTLYVLAMCYHEMRCYDSPDNKIYIESNEPDVISLLPNRPLFLESA